MSAEPQPVFPRCAKGALTRMLQHRAWQAIAQQVPFKGVLVKLAVVFGICAGLILIAGRDPWLVLGELWQGAFGSPQDLAVSLNRATPLLLTGAGMTLALRAGAFNMGVEGQIALGGLAAATAGLGMGSLPSAIALLLLLGLSALAGMAWSGLSALLCLWRGVNVVIVTLLMNFIALLLVSATVTGPIGATGEGFPATPRLAEHLRIPIIWPGTVMHGGILLGVLAVGVLWWVLWRTGLGYQLRICGSSPEVARYLRLKPERAFWIGMMVSGALAGMAGAVEVLGVRYRLFDGFSQNLGWDAIAVALLGRSDPAGVLPAGLFFGALRAATGAAQRRTGIPSALATVVQGLTIVLVSISLFQGSRKGIPAEQSPSNRVDPSAPEQGTEP